MTVRDMITRFQDRLDDYAVAFWNDRRAISLLNTYKDKIVQELSGLAVEYVYDFLSVADQQDYEVPMNYVANRYLFYDPTSTTYNNEIKIKDTPSAIYGSFTDPTETGYPSRGFISQSGGRRIITIHPTFGDDGITVRWWFYGFPMDVANDNDVLPLPVEWHPSIVEGMVAQAKADDRLIGVGDCLAIWIAEVRKIKAMDVTKTIVERGGQYGTYEDNFPRIRTGSDADDWIHVAPAPWRIE